MTTGQDQSIAIVLAAHGDRGGDGGNAHLSDHAAALRDQGNFAGVYWGVLNGEPTIEDALKEADACGADQIVVYPLFMSAGYFVTTVLADRIAAAELTTPTGIMQPLGLDKRLALLMLEHAMRTSRAADLDPADARLLIVGHGSKNGPESADATRRAARLLSEQSPYASIETAFIEEEPLFRDVLAGHDGTTVVAGFLSGDGLHAGEDVPNVIKQTGARALYTGPIGLHPRVPELIMSAVARAVKEQDQPGTPVERLSSSAPAAAAPPSSIETPKADAEPEQEPKPAPAASRSTRRRAGPLRMLLKIAAVVVGLFVLAAGAVAFLVPDDLIREQVVSAVKQKTGRTLSIGGSTSFSIFPNVGVEMEDVAISNPPEMAQGETLRIKVLNVNLKLVPLLSRRVEIDQFVLEHPVFNLVVDRQGRKNWDFTKTALLDDGARRRVVAAAEPKRPRMIMAQAGGLGGGAVRDISLGTVKITNGTLNYADEGSGVQHAVKAINVTVLQPQLSEPLEVDGDLVWHGEKIEFDGWLEDVPALVKDKSSGARFNYTSRHTRGSFDGALAVSPALAAKGVLKNETPSIRGLADWLGNPLPPGGGLGPLAIQGDLSLVNDVLTFSNAKLSIDGMNGNGQVEVRLKGVRPFVTASLNLDKLDLNPYIADQQTASRAVAPAEPLAPQPGKTPRPQSGGSLTDFIKKLEKDPETKPKTQVRAWSQEAVNYSGLRAVDADFKLSAKEMLYRTIKTGQNDVDANIRSGVLTADLKLQSVYSGTGTGKVTLNGARAVPGIAATFNLNNISALPLLQDAASFKWLSGKTNLAFSITGSGRSQTEIMRSLQGNGSFAFGNGAIEGINIPAMVRGMKEGRFDGWKRDDRQKTDFSELSATFTIQQGVATNNDLTMVGPLLRATGKGTVDIGNERVDYSALPRLVASLQGQGAQLEEGRGIAVPVSFTGPWEDTKVKVDFERMLNDPELAQDAINEVGKALQKDGELNNVLKGLFGGGNQQGQGGAPGQPQGEQVSPGDVLKNLFKKQ